MTARLAAILGALLLVVSPALAQDTVVDPQAEEAFFRGVGLLEAGEAADAVAEFDLAVTLQPDFRRAYYYMSRAQVAEGDWSAARQSAEAYSRFELVDVEREQLDELIAEIDAGAPRLAIEESEEQLTPPPPSLRRTDRVDREANRSTTTAPERREARTEEALGHVERGSASMTEGDCDSALESAQEALSLDPSVTSAFLLKGLALECTGELERARAILLTYGELSPEPSTVALRAIERIDQRLAIAAIDKEAELVERVQSRALGNDPHIEGVLDDQWGDARPDGRRARSESLPGLGKADVSTGRLNLAGSRAEGQVARIYNDDGLVFSRLRIWGRDGLDTGGWYARAFSELYLSIVGKAGEPVLREGLPDPRQPSRNSFKALTGKHRWEVVWQDADGDQIVLRLGRCSGPGQRHDVLAENLPCLELVGTSGRFHPEAQEVASSRARAVRLSETPGPRQWDVDVAIGGGFAPGGVVSTTGGPGLAVGELTLDLLGRFNIGPLSAGVGWAPGLGLASEPLEAPVAYFESRFTFYVGVRDRPRQPRWRTFLFGFGMVPDQTRQGIATVSPAISLRVIDQTRTTPLGQFWFSLEPYVVFGVDAVKIVPLRFSIGAIVGTRARLAGDRQPDPPRWEPSAQ